MSYFSVNKTFFTIWDYHMSYIEFFGTILNVISVFLLVKKNIINWVVGVIATLSFGILFYQIHLYADLAEQVWYFITGIIGWVMWDKAKKKDTKVVVRKLTWQVGWGWVFATMILGTVLLMYVIGHLNDWFPHQFPAEASYLFLDTSTTVASFIATVLMMMRYVENWYIWISVDIIAIWLYWRKEVPFLSVLYVMFLILAIRGALEWRQTHIDQEGEVWHKSLINTA